METLLGVILHAGFLSTYIQYKMVSRLDIRSDIVAYEASI